MLQQLLNGLTLGSIYALMALGYTMVYGVLELINFAHGEVYMVGAFIGLFLIQNSNVPFFLAFASSMAFAALLGVIIERVAYRPLRKAPRLAALISAIGMSIFVQNLLAVIMGPQTRSFPIPFKIVQISFGGMRLSSFDLLILLLSLGLMVGLHVLVHKTKVGKAMRATAQDRNTAGLMGVSVNRIISVTFAVGSALAAAGGMLVGMNFNSVEPWMGVMPGLKGFVAAVLGGIGSIPGAMAGGILLGTAEVMGVALLRSEWRDAIAFAVLIIVLLVKPSGIFGRKTEEKV